MNQTTADGHIDAFHTVQLSPHEINTREINSLHNYLKLKFKLYITMNISHSEFLENHEIYFNSLTGDYYLNGNCYHRNLRWISSILVRQFKIKNPNSRKKWINL